MTAPCHQCRVARAPWAGVHSVRTESERHFGRHWHDTYGIGVLEQGAQRSASGRGEVDAQAGDLLACNPGEVHDGRPLGGGARRWRMVHFDRAVLAAAAGREDIELTRPVICDPQLQAALRHLLGQLEAWQAGRAGTDLDLLACEESLAVVLGRLLAAHASAAPLSLDAGDHVARLRERLHPRGLAARDGAIAFKTVRPAARRVRRFATPDEQPRCLRITSSPTPTPSGRPTPRWPRWPCMPVA